MAHGAIDRAMPFLTTGEQPFHNPVAQPACRHIGDAQQANVIVRVQKRFQKRKHIAYLAAVEEALPAN